MELPLFDEVPDMINLSRIVRDEMERAGLGVKIDLSAWGIVITGAHKEYSGQLLEYQATPMREVIGPDSSKSRGRTILDAVIENIEDLLGLYGLMYSHGDRAYVIAKKN
ncbi:hypothetical protein HYX01_01155 [Candidatus Woesearchaeota archaeon]|nr:hypothetical protein [Candidatus Woesearchaeota archaeon]